MPTEPTILALVADMDGTLLDTELLAKTTWRAAASVLGFDLTEEVFMSLLGINMRDCYAILGKTFGPKFVPETFTAECNRQNQLYIEANGTPVKPGAKELLEWCAGRGWPRAVATSSNLSDAEHHLSRAGLRPYFDLIVAGDSVTNGKPHPEIFLSAAAALKVAPENCLALEDSSNGVRSARAAGMTTFLIPDLLPPSEEIRQLAHRVFPSLLDVRDYLRALPSR